MELSFREDCPTGECLPDLGNFQAWTVVPASVSSNYMIPLPISWLDKIGLDMA